MTENQRTENEIGAESDMLSEESMISEENILSEEDMLLYEELPYGQGITSGAGQRKRKRWTAALLILTGVLCLAGAGLYFYERTQSDTAREYDGVLVQERWEEVV